MDVLSETTDGRAMTGTEGAVPDMDKLTVGVDDHVVVAVGDVAVVYVDIRSPYRNTVGVV